MVGVYRTRLQSVILSDPASNGDGGWVIFSLIRSPPVSLWQGLAVYLSAAMSSQTTGTRALETVYARSPRAYTVHGV